MPDGTDLSPEDPTGSEPSLRPRVAACRSCPETVVFIEADNTDGWLATDLTVDVER